MTNKKENNLIKVIIVEDHRVLRDSFCLAFNNNGFLVVGTTESAAASDDLCLKLKPDLLLMDVCTDGGASGLNALMRLREKLPDMKIILMSGFDELSYSPRAKEMGADAFIFKNKGIDFFLEMARRVLEGEKYFPEDRKIPMPNGETPFTARETEILRQLCLYKTRQKIAEELFISEKTLKKHVENMLTKSGFVSATELIIYVISNGWINPKF